MTAAVSADDIWALVQDELARAVDEPAYHLWLEPLRALELDGARLVVRVPPQAERWIRDRYGRILQRSVERVVGDEAVLELVSGAADVQRRGLAESTGAGRRGDEAENAGHGARRRSAPLGNPKLTFEQFVIGDSNRLAHAAALAVAEMPANAYNPLFLCGPPGLGKTHLMSSIAALLLSHDPTLAVRCTTGEAFTNDFLRSLAGGHTDRFKGHFRDVDVLLVDDVQFLERKARTEEEFFHTFNALHDAGRQIVVTSDRPPADLKALEDRLRERFEAGLVADIKPPDRVTRLAILRMRTHHDRVELADDGALRVLADRITTNVRVLEGALIRTVAYSSLTGRPITRELAEEVLDSLYPATHREPRSFVGQIQDAACEHFGVTLEELTSHSRAGRISWPRHVAMYLARELTGDSLPAIGRQFGGRDHTTVLNACRRAQARINADADTRRAVESLRHMIARESDNPCMPPDRRD